MSPRFQVRAAVRCGFMALAAAITVARAAPASNKLPELSQIGKLGAAEAARVLEQFRRSGIAGEYYFEFELRALPRRGEESLFHGRLWGGRNEIGAVNRIELVDGERRQHRLLVQNGAQAAVWRLAEGRVAQLGIAALFAPVIPGVEITAFDLQMPFLYWPDAEYQGFKRILGRPAHAFLFRPPIGFSAENSDVSAARAYLDTQFNALLQTELIGRSGRIVKTFSLVSLKTVDQQPVPKSVDFLNAITRDKTRFQVKGVALKLDLAPSLFDPATLGEEIRPPVAASIVRLD